MFYILPRIPPCLPYRRFNIVLSPFSFLTGFGVVNFALLFVALYFFALEEPEDPKGQSESVNQRRTDTTMPQNKRTIGPTTIYK